METLNISPSKEAMFSSSQIRSREGIGRKLPQVNGRFSVPVFDSSYKSKAPTPLKHYRCTTCNFKCNQNIFIPFSSKETFD
jgi:hypothetical protein